MERDRAQHRHNRRFDPFAQAVGEALSTRSK